MKKRYVAALVVVTAILSAVVGAKAAQSNFLGVVWVADPSTTSNQVKVNADGSINVNCL